MVLFWFSCLLLEPLIVRIPGGMPDLRALKKLFFAGEASSLLELCCEQHALPYDRVMNSTR